MYDYLVVGSGLYGATFAYEANKKGKKVLVIEKKNHIAGNIYTEIKEGIPVHKYGAHIFHTSDKEVWEYIQKFAEFNRYTNSPIAKYKNEIYNLPFNMNTFNKMWNISTPEEAQNIIETQVRDSNILDPRNLEEQAISLVGYDIYEKLIKGYTEKQWGMKATELPAFIIRRLPVRYTYDNNYFNDLFQGIPIGGYTQIVEKMLEGIEVRLNTDYLDFKEELETLADKVIYTGMIDEYYEYCYGELEYRSLRFHTETLSMQNYQGNAVVNYTEADVPYTRVIEHKHFEITNRDLLELDKTIITKEYPEKWMKGKDSYYPINNELNNNLFQKYYQLSLNQNKVIFGGRLGLYQYFDMDKIVKLALELVNKIII